MKKKIAIYLLVGMMIAGGGCNNTTLVEAAELWKVEDDYTNNEDHTAIMRADVIVKKYRINHGKQQYRRWNETRGKWVDPAWIDI
jgi:hypothetical protein